LECKIDFALLLECKIDFALLLECKIDFALGFEIGILILIQPKKGAPFEKKGGLGELKLIS